MFSCVFAGFPRWFSEGKMTSSAPEHASWFELRRETRVCGLSAAVDPWRHALIRMLLFECLFVSHHEAISRWPSRRPCFFCPFSTELASWMRMRQDGRDQSGVHTLIRSLFASGYIRCRLCQHSLGERPLVSVGIHWSA